MKITDLDSDCLDGCFGLLSIEDLLNVADSNEELRQAARNVYYRMYRQTEVHLAEVTKLTIEGDRPCKCCHRSRYRLELCGNTLHIQELKLGLQLLRCFGDLVSKIEFNFRCRSISPFNPLKHCRSYLIYTRQCAKAYEWDQAIVEYINKFCAKSLKSLKVNGSNLNLTKLERPFENVEHLKTNIILNQKNLHQLFPKVRILKVICSGSNSNTSASGLNDDFIANHFPYLEHLRMDISGQYKWDFATALHLNPQIKTLAGNCWFEVLFDAKNIQFYGSNDRFRNLERLDLRVDNGNEKIHEILEKPITEELQLNNVKQLSIAFGSRPRASWNFPFICKNLESLTLSLPNSRLVQFSNLLNKHPTVKIFRFAFSLFARPYPTNENDCTIISNAFPLLEELVFEAIPDNIVRIVRLFPSLKCFRCYTRPIPRLVEYNHLVRSLHSWSLSEAVDPDNPYIRNIVKLIEGKRVEMKRKLEHE